MNAGVILKNYSCFMFFLYNYGKINTYELNLYGAKSLRYGGKGERKTLIRFLSPSKFETEHKLE